MKKRTVEEAIKNQTIRRNYYGEIKKGIFTDEVHDIVGNFFVALSSVKGMSAYRICLIIDDMKRFVEDIAMKEEIK